MSMRCLCQPGQYNRLAPEKAGHALRIAKSHAATYENDGTPVTHESWMTQGARRGLALRWSKDPCHM
jgi:hypothetical protein